MIIHVGQFLLGLSKAETQALTNYGSGEDENEEEEMEEFEAGPVDVQTSLQASADGQMEQEVRAAQCVALSKHWRSCLGLTCNCVLFQGTTANEPQETKTDQTGSESDGETLLLTMKNSDWLSRI